MKTILLIATSLGLCVLAKAQNVNYNVNMTPAEQDARRQATALANDPGYQYGLIDSQAIFQRFQQYLHDINRAARYDPSPEVVVIGGSTPSRSTSTKETPVKGLSVTPAYNQGTGVTYDPSPDVVLVGRRADGSTYRLEGKETQIPKSARP